MDKKTKASITALVRRIEAQKARIGKERDRLREMVEDAEAILENCDQAEESLQYAINALSELV